MDQRRRRALFWILQIGGWALFGVAMLAAGLSQNLPAAVPTKASLTVLGFGASLALRFLYRAAARRGVSMAALALSAAPLSLAAAGAWMAAHHAVLAARHATRAGPVLATPPDFTNTIYYFFLLLAWSALYLGIPAYLELVDHRERLLRAEASAHEARLRALRFQLNPHFLFNALNGISTLVADSKNAEANRMISRLAEFLRATLDGGGVDEIPLGDELAFARRYLEIEESRFGDRLKVDIAVEAGAARALVPPMILQPIVENAVRHAIHPREGGGTISIAAARRNGWLAVDIDDDGPGLDAGGAERAGVGLSNTRTRLEELYGPDAGLELGRSRRGGLAVSIRIPWRVLAEET